MESEGTTTDPAIAAAQLAALQAGRAAMAERAMQPWWHDATLGVLVFQLVFGLLFGNAGYAWVAEITGFAAGFGLSFLLVPGGWRRVRAQIRGQAAREAVRVDVERGAQPPVELREVDRAGLQVDQKLPGGRVVAEGAAHIDPFAALEAREGLEDAGRQDAAPVDQEPVHAS